MDGAHGLLVRSPAGSGDPGDADSERGTAHPARPGGERSGSGLGLAIVRRVMALHGGQMQVRNTAPGLRVELQFPSL